MPQWRPGDVANGYRLNDSGTVWEPLPSGKKPWFKRPLAITGLAVGSLVLLSGTVGALGGGSSGDTAGSATTTAPKPAVVVVHVVDGDTISLDSGEKVRLVGIDTPEKGQCNYEAATRKMETLVLGKRVTLGDSDEDRDKLGRLLRYVDVGTLDAGLEMLKSGLAVARYDSRDGYGAHPREALYVATDNETPNRTCTNPSPAPRPTLTPEAAQPTPTCQVGYDPCLPVVADLDCSDINGSVRVTGDDPYRLDRDGDGIGCES